MLNNEIKDFVYHEFKTDSDNFVKDLAKLLALGNYTKEAKDVAGNLMRNSMPSIEDSWNIVFPNPDFSLVSRDVKSFEELNGKEYETVTLDQIKRITDNVVVKATSKPHDRIEDSEVITPMSAEHSANPLGIVEETNVERSEMYLEIFFPKFLCDSEVDDPTIQRDGVTVPKCINRKTGKKDAQVRNYHNCFMRIFDKPNKDFSGPAENVIDMVTGDISEFNSASSEWVKLSWFADFEDLFKSELGIPGADGTLRIPITSSLTNKTKVKVYANIHPNRVILTVVGNPNVDYSDNRYLIGQAYVGSIDSFEFSKKDIVGNFGIYSTSSSAPAIPKFTTKYSAPFNAVDELGSDNGKTPNKEVTFNGGEKGSWVKIGSFNRLSNTLKDNRPGDITLKYVYNRRVVPRNFDDGIAGGMTTIYEPSLKVTLGNRRSSDNKTYEYVGDLSLVNNSDYTYAQTKIGRNKLTYPTDLPIKIEKPVVRDTYVEVLVTYNEQDLYNYFRQFIQPNDTTGKLDDPKCSINLSYNGYATNSYQASIYLGFDEIEEMQMQTGGVNRDKYGNMVEIKYHKTYGLNTANGTTDFAMYMTDSADYFQSHYFMFSSTEQFLKKHMYGKSSYTGEYFADKIRIVHSSEGLRGSLSGLIVIDAESLFPFDELIVNKGFTKYDDKPEETYVYLPLTAGYTPFANSPNERYGVGLLKEIKFNENNNSSKCDAALREIQEIYKDIYTCTNNEESIYLIDACSNGLETTWTVSDSTIFHLSEGSGGGELDKPLSISPASPTVVIGQTTEIKVLEEQIEVEGSKVVWTSSDKGILTVNNGIVTGVSVGEAIITARYKAKKVQVLVSVTQVQGEVVTVSTRARKK